MDFLNILFSQGFEGARKITAAALSFFMAASSSSAGNMGAHQKLIEKALERNTIEITSDFSISVDADALEKNIEELNEAFEKEVEYANTKKAPKGYATGVSGVYASYFLFNEELEFTPMKFYLPEEEIPGIYENGDIDISGFFTLKYDSTAKEGSVDLTLSGVEGDFAFSFDSTKITLSPDLTRTVFEFLPAEYNAVYTEHFKNLSYSTDLQPFIDMLFDENGKLSHFFDQFSFYSHSLPKELSDFTYDEILTLLGDEGFTERFSTFFKEYTKPVSKHFVKRTVEGCDARIFELTGEDYLDYRIGLYDHVKDDSVISAYKALSEYVHSKESLSFLQEGELFEFTDKKEIENAIATYAHRRRDIAEFMNASPNVRPVPDVNLLRFYYKHSRLKHTIFEKDGDTHTRLEFVIAKNENDALVTLGINSVISNAKSEIPTQADANTEKQIDGELFDNKLSQNAAREKGVTGLCIDWNSKMTSGAQNPEISSVRFEVEYKNTEKLERESGAHLVDGSVYLPLRQLMESAGYEVSWDADAYKAYVTVDGKKIEMTGKLIDSKTYVKVRDFEKLGAKVDYSEKVHYANAHDDFFKECRAVITFNG